MTSMTIECASFRAIPISEGRVRLEITEPAAPRKEVYGAGEAVARLSELFGKPVYSDDELVKWAQGRMTSCIP